MWILTLNFDPHNWTIFIGLPWKLMQIQMIKMLLYPHQGFPNVGCPVNPVYAFVPYLKYASHQ
jgi:hypothetical protein